MGVADVEEAVTREVETEAMVTTLVAIADDLPTLLGKWGSVISPEQSEVG